MLQIPKILKPICLGLITLALMSDGQTKARHTRAKSRDKPSTAVSLSFADKKHLLQDNFVIVKTVKELPKSVLNGLLDTEEMQGMADAGKPFQESDVIESHKPLLPFRRLVFAGLSAEYSLIYNEYGGYGHGTEVYFYHLSAGNATLVWKAGLTDSRASLGLMQLRSEIINGRFYDLERVDYRQSPTN